ncbi:GNAT family N-acetyltransferase [Paenibacillus sabuli]|uniref:GNAT family N-acetyltransferase n=1 Tax=Paenibacillus sabuli TaxID=2772509 RepID=UPI00295B36A8|nr:GNAT family N-acetyltransferase [Paenibacillus sabuli]
MNIWEGAKVRLRPIRTEDWQAFHVGEQDSEAARLFDAIYFPRSEEGSRAWAAQHGQRRAIGDDMTLAIETTEGELAGRISAHGCSARHGHFKYGVLVFRPHWRRGYGAEAVRLLLRYYFEELRYERASAHVYAFNEGSIALQERLGFQLEGRLRSMIYTGGTYHDEYVYGLLREEFTLA